MNHVDPEDALRSSLRRHAAEAPQADLLAERVIARAGMVDRPTRRSPLRTWTLPVLTSAGVAAAAVVVAVAVTDSGRHQAGPPAPGVSRSVSVTQVPSRPAPSATSAHPAPVNPVGLTHFWAADLTFVSDTHGWALGTADCLDGSGKTCTALVHTTDGRHWTARGQNVSTPFNLGPGCTTACVRNIRFANDLVGYVFGPSALFMTLDGGRHWSAQRGGALFLETLNHNVIRVTGSPEGCPGPCDVRVETAAIGSASWTDAGLGPLSGAAFAFSRGGHGAYLLAMRNPAGGANDATATLYRSRDDGRHWTGGGEPCPQAGGEVDSYAVAGAPDGRVSVLCRARATQALFVATSADAGAHFAARGSVPPGAFPMLTGDPDTVLVSAGKIVARSTDGGASWRTVRGITGGVVFVGFESSKVGRAISGDGRTIWTTVDAGRSWTPFTFR